jgi:hypothetical protein
MIGFLEARNRSRNMCPGYLNGYRAVELESFRLTTKVRTSELKSMKWGWAFEFAVFVKLELASESARAEDSSERRSEEVGLAVCQDTSTLGVSRVGCISSGGGVA